MVGGWTISGMAELSAARDPAREQSHSSVADRVLDVASASHVSDCAIRRGMIEMLPFRSGSYKRKSLSGFTDRPRLYL